MVDCVITLLRNCVGVDVTLLKFALNIFAVRYRYHVCTQCCV